MLKQLAISALILGTSEAIHSHHRFLPEELSPSSTTATLDVDMQGTLSNLSESESVWKHGMSGIPSKEEQQVEFELV